jgi:hypothetical protein
MGESTVEEAALAWFESLGYAMLYGPDIAAKGRDHGGQAVAG